MTRIRIGDISQKDLKLTSWARRHPDSAGQCFTRVTVPLSRSAKPSVTLSRSMEGRRGCLR
jgi:hypothetical protein